MSELSPDEEPIDETPDKVYLGIDLKTGEIAEYIPGVPSAEIDAEEYQQACGDPAIKKLLDDAEAERRFWERLSES